MSSTFKHISLKALLIVLPLCGMWQIGSASYIHAKAILAQVLLETAWDKTVHGQQEVKPWPWADTWPISRLDVPGLGIDRIVLAGASGSSLAFGPGHLFGSPLPGQQGNTVIAGHRDTHFRFLKDIKRGELIRLQSNKGRTIDYEVSETIIVDEKQAEYLANTSENTLTLITCYPFDAIRPGGPLRYLVIAKQQSPVVNTGVIHM
ncbi:MAG: class GN sortase [Gammaproteobacteria bacterium]|nr:MAG: class GN sortase [Gammaproteobacteria bacterium]